MSPEATTKTTQKTTITPTSRVAQELRLVSGAAVWRPCLVLVEVVGRGAIVLK